MYAHVHIFNLFGHSHRYGQKNKMKLGYFIERNVTTSTIPCVAIRKMFGSENVRFSSLFGNSRVNHAIAFRLRLWVLFVRFRWNR